MNPPLKVGLALGSGSSRGWSHIGIIRELAREGIEPAIVCGTSIGSLVGAAYVAGNIDRLEDWVLSLTRFETARFLEISPSLNGFVNTERLYSFLQKHVADEGVQIASLSKQYAAVSTSLEKGREIWLSEGSLIQAVWASIALPGLFPPIKRHQQWLVDGGLVNPVPVSVCRAMGADVVIAVNLNGDIVGKHMQPAVRNDANNSVTAKITDLVMEYTGTFFETETAEQPPSLFEAMAGSINIMQDRITRSRMAGDPPDVLLHPRLSHIGLLEFYRAAESIREGEKCVQRMMPEISRVLEMNQSRL